MGKMVPDATFSVSEVWSNSCVRSWVDLNLIAPCSQNAPILAG